MLLAGRSFLLINTNVARPPVSPVGLEYVGEALVRAKVPVQVLDLAFETDWKAALVRALKDGEPLVHRDKAGLPPAMHLLRRPGS